MQPTRKKRAAELDCSTIEFELPLGAFGALGAEEVSQS